MREATKSQARLVREFLHATTIARVLHQSKLHGRVVKRKPLSKKAHVGDSNCSLGMWKTLRSIGWRFFGLMKQTFPTVMHGGGSIMLWGCFFAADPGRLVKQNIGISWRTIWFSLQFNYNLGEDLFSSNTMTKRIQRKICRHGLRQLGQCSGVAESKPRPQSNREFVAGLEKRLFTPNPCASWQSLRSFAKKKQVKFQYADVQGRLRPFHADSVLWLRPKVHSLNNDLKGVNIFAIPYFTLCINLINWHYIVQIYFPFALLHL